MWDINIWNFNVSLTNDVVSFEQPGPVCYFNTGVSIILYFNSAN